MGVIAALLLAGAGSDGSTATAAPAAGYGSEIVFHGWSQTSSFIAYTRTRRRPPSRVGRKPPPPEVQRMHRQVLAGTFAGFGSQVGGDVAGWATARAYIVEPAPRSRPTPARTVFVGPGEVDLVLELTVGERLGWVLRRSDGVLAQHTFDALYVETDAELFIAPDRSQAVLVMHLHTGWVTDSAIYPIALER